jgi:myo-inositol-1(or 4)-monophosphatase
MDLDRAMRVAVRAAYRGAEVLRSGLGSGFEVRRKGPRDLVTDLDFASEKEIVRTIREAFPDHAVVAEESGNASAAPGLGWLVDPLDGTVNYAHRVPFFGISIALVDGQVPVVGVVLNPVSGELFSAVAGQGSRLNGDPIRVSDQARLDGSLLATGFPCGLEQGLDTLTGRLERCLKASGGVRRLGSASLDLCFVASGRFEGFWEQGLQPWDLAAGILIVREAGGNVTDFAGGPDVLPKGEVLATNNRIHAEMLALMEVEKS